MGITGCFLTGLKLVHERKLRPPTVNLVKSPWLDRSQVVRIVWLSGYGIELISEYSCLCLQISAVPAITKKASFAVCSINAETHIWPKLWEICDCRLFSLKPGFHSIPCKTQEKFWKRGWEECKNWRWRVGSYNKKLSEFGPAVAFRSLLQL